MKVRIGAFALVLSTFLGFPLIQAAHATAVAFRTYDGSGNNLSNSAFGTTDIPLLRPIAANYPGDGSGSSVSGSGLPNARDISNRLLDQRSRPTSNRYLSDFVWIWGQFLDHDLDLTGSDAGNGTMTVAITDSKDPFFPVDMTINRSNYESGTGTADRPREQTNRLTSFIDASNVYGSDATRADALRTGVDGKLKTSTGNLLPFNTDGLENDGGDDNKSLFLAGDIRANEQVGLTSMHTLFLREHNRLADLIVGDPRSAALATSSGISLDEFAYQTARKIVGAEMQVVTYGEFLPALFGDWAPKASDFTYDALVNPSISQEFSTAAYRLHSMISPTLQLIDDAGQPVGSMSLQEVFFKPNLLADDPQLMDQLFRGFASQTAQNYDVHIVDELRNFLFGRPGSGGMDLGVLNIMRGRDHGLPDYNSLREAYGLGRLSDFSDITDDLGIAQILSDLYGGDIDRIDAWVGMVSERHVPGSSFGELATAIIVDQFTRLRDGDRFFFLNDDFLTDPLITSLIDLDTLTLADIIGWNTGAELAGDIFRTNQQVPAPAGLMLMVIALGVFGVYRRLH